MSETPEAPEVRRREPTRARMGAWVSDYPDGVQVIRYDDGRVKIGRTDSRILVEDVSNYRTGNSRGSAHAIVRLVDAQD